MPNRRFTIALLIVLVTLGVVSFACFLANAWHVALLLQRLDTPEMADLGLTTADNLVMTVESVQSLAGLIAFVILLVWVGRTVAWLRRELGEEAYRYTPAWAVGSWFVPVLNFWMPYQVMHDMFVHLAPDQKRWIGWWWGLTLLATVLVIGTAVYGITAGELADFALLGSLSMAVHLASTASTGMLVRTLYGVVPTQSEG